jgi:hypothetical protein
MKTAENKKADAKTHFANPHFSFSAVIKKMVRDEGFDERTQ